MNNDDTDSRTMNYAVRMVVPMRREFGRTLNVVQFLHDFAYAREVLDQALSSSDARLREYASYIETRIHGSRVADSKSEPRKTPADRIALQEQPKTAAPISTPLPTADELRARIMKKYTDGLR